MAHILHLTRPQPLPCVSATLHTLESKVMSMSMTHVNPISCTPTPPPPSPLPHPSGPKLIKKSSPSFFYLSLKVPQRNSHPPPPSPPFTHSHLPPFPYVCMYAGEREEGRGGGIGMHRGGMVESYNPPHFDIWVSKQVRNTRSYLTTGYPLAIIYQACILENLESILWLYQKPTKQSLLHY